MNKDLLLGLGRFLLRIPQPIWQQEVARSARSEEHAREVRHKRMNARGSYMRLAQSVFSTPSVQGAIFGFPRNER